MLKGLVIIRGEDKFYLAYCFSEPEEFLEDNLWINSGEVAAMNRKYPNSFVIRFFSEKKIKIDYFSISGEKSISFHPYDFIVIGGQYKVLFFIDEYNF